MADAEETDFLVIGAGVAGLRAAIELAETGRVLVLTKEVLGESNTNYAQGGIAVALGGEEDVALHLEDTLAAGDGLVDREAAQVLVSEGPLRVEELLAWGTGFDRENGKLMLTREAAHSRNRILHANGDATGAEISRSLIAYARKHPNITLVEWATSVDLLAENGEVFGVTYLDREGLLHTVIARATLLASGGAGQVYSDTTNPAVATGDGIAIAWRAGAVVADMEFYQFHPTALSLPGVPRFLLSEALRGEGAWLRNSQGERFMERYHPLLELAPRDVVARAITREGFGPQNTTLPVYLDMRHVTGLDFTRRFPGISRFLAEHGLSLATDLIPIRPAAHYYMGGVRTNLDGQTSLKRLYAAGEAACTGVHGANRLASNSLLEGLVFGARAAKAMLGSAPLTAKIPKPPMLLAPFVLDEQAARQELQRGMWQDAGLLRDAEGLGRMRSLLDMVALQPVHRFTRATVELANLYTLASLIVASAQERHESRGAHFRNDYPKRNDAQYAGMHTLLEGSRISFGALAEELSASTSGSRR